MGLNPQQKVIISFFSATRPLLNTFGKQCFFLFEKPKTIFKKRGKWMLDVLNVGCTTWNVIHTTHKVYCTKHNVGYTMHNVSHNTCSRTRRACGTTKGPRGAPAPINEKNPFWTLPSSSISRSYQPSMYQHMT